MLKATFSVLGGDLRQSYLAAYLCNLGQEVTAFAVPALPDSLSYCPYPAINLREALAGAGWWYVPFPFPGTTRVWLSQSRNLPPQGKNSLRLPQSKATAFL